jgi:hypothetical protein
MSWHEFVPSSKRVRLPPSPLAFRNLPKLVRFEERIAGLLTPFHQGGFEPRKFRRKFRPARHIVELSRVRLQVEKLEFRRIGEGRIVVWKLKTSKNGKMCE